MMIGTGSYKDSQCLPRQDRAPRLLQDRQEEILSSRELEQAQLVFAIGNAMDGAGLGLNGRSFCDWVEWLRQIKVTQGDGEFDALIGEAFVTACAKVPTWNESDSTRHEWMKTHHHIAELSAGVEQQRTKLASHQLL